MLDPESMYRNPKHWLLIYTLISLCSPEVCKRHKTYFVKSVSTNLFQFLLFTAVHDTGLSLRLLLFLEFLGLLLDFQLQLLVLLRPVHQHPGHALIRKK
jgi:hypothetical protein